MTAVDTRPAVRGHDVRHASRVLAAVLLPVGPACIAALRFVLPYTTADDGSTIVRGVAAHQGRETAVLWLGLVAAFTIVPAVLWAGRVAVRHAPRLGGAALILMVPGYVAVSWLMAGDAAVLYGVRHGLSTAMVADMYTNLHPTFSVAEGIFVLGHVVGTTLLGIAFVRTAVLPRWAAVAILVSQPLHFVAAVILGSHWLDLVAWGLTAVGFAAISVVVLRTSDDDWAPAPVR
jgi:hypothetical protein